MFKFSSFLRLTIFSCSCAKYIIIKSFFIDNCQTMCTATIQVWNIIQWNSLPLQKSENYNDIININFWTHSSKLPYSVNVILTALKWTLTPIMWSLIDRWIQFVVWSREVRMPHYRILISSNWILVVIAISKSVKISFPWNKIIFHLQSEA